MRWGKFSNNFSRKRPRTQFGLISSPLRSPSRGFSVIKSRRCHHDDNAISAAARYAASKSTPASLLEDTTKCTDVTLPGHESNNYELEVVGELDDGIGLALQEAARQRERLAAALAGNSMRLVIDCGLPHATRSHTEFRSLAKQIQTAVGHNKRSTSPLCLQVTSWLGELASYAEESMGATAWPLVKHTQLTLELYDPEELVVLSPDAEEPLLTLDERRVYVVGGVVDRSVVRGITAGFASSHSLQVRRLPTLEYADQLGLGRDVSRRPVLNICDVVLALLRFRTNGGDWVDALDAAIPKRKRTQGDRSTAH